MKRYFKILMSVCLFIALSTQFAFASTEGNISDKYENKKEPVIQGVGIIYYYSGTKTLKNTISKEWVEDLTTTWAYNASSYVVTKTSTTTWSWQGSLTRDFSDNIKGTFQITYTTSNASAIGTTIAVTYPNKFSKLAFYSDYNIYNCTMTKYSSLSPNPISDPASFTLKEPAPDNYVMVKYQ